MDRLRRMEIFVKVVEAGQFTLAAKQLSLSKSTVSQSLVDLERYLGLQLIKRNSRSLNLTPAGEKYYSDCLRILADIGTSEDRVRQESLGVMGKICITAPVSFGTYVMAPIISKFMTANPNVSIDMNLGERRLDLISEGIDFALRVGSMKDSGLLARKIGEARMIMCAAPSYLARFGTPTSIKDLSDHALLRYSRSPAWNLLEGEPVVVDPIGRVSTNNGENLRELAIAGQGIAYMPHFIAGSALEAGTLVPIMSGHASDPIDIRIVRPADRHCPARVRKLIDFIVTEFKHSSR